MTPTCEHGQGGGLSGPVVTQQHGDLTLEHVEGQVPHGLPRLVTQRELLHIDPSVRGGSLRQTGSLALFQSIS